uniref:RING-type domain-containing protein n=1 Tax=Chromera velia CCMP2878 TaxID=1169474 RepID=A0A0G4HQQ4_9ALVE|eukprot:Cvel_1252.t1-p1 / transcript=Cvel_1252.t1 / gene=Cvel_1252 / organism=Chromera_velia_CCMP2878 / gene_product=RING finger protein 151, putative / transcript_product=RING finger protein 151, putative / location=Cvel_scaffold42:33600-35375(+) / protein_length=387 / sequence_SO=supercontig / SO=protein_coding / is_pseudo=false
MNASGGIRRLGLDISFAADGFDQLAANAICSICHDYMEDVVEVDCQARHIFCRPCAQMVYDRGQPCPECRGHMSRIETAHLRIRSPIEQVKWKCTNFQQGCEFSDTKKELEKHLDKECEQEETKCPFRGCGQKGHRAIILQHKAVCPPRPVPCTHCHAAVPFDAMVGHLSRCVKVPIPCPSGCGKNLPRGEIDLHRQTECEEQTVCCEVPGCGQGLKRKDMGTHQNENMQKHMKLLTSRLLALDSTPQSFTVLLPEYEAKAAGVPVYGQLRSAYFSFKGFTFNLGVYPKGMLGSEPGMAVVSLHKLGDFKGELSYSIEAATGNYKKTFAFSLVNIGDGRGKTNFCRAEDLLRAARSRQDRALEIRVTLSAPAKDSEASVIEGYAPSV